MRLIAANRSPDSHVAGGLALNLNTVRLSDDIDIFQNMDVDVEAVARADIRVLETAGLEVSWKTELKTMFSAYVRGEDDVTRIDWAQDAEWRFFPAQPDPDLGWVLHPFDLATNKALAAGGRREPRDYVDLLTIHETLYPLSTVIWAAVGKDEGYSPESLIRMLVRFGRFRDEELVRLRFSEPLSARDLLIRLREVLAEADTFVARMPSSHAGLIFMQEGRIVEPDPERLDQYETRPASRRGLWPVVAPADLPTVQPL